MAEKYYFEALLNHTVSYSPSGYRQEFYAYGDSRHEALRNVLKVFRLWKSQDSRRENEKAPIFPYVRETVMGENDSCRFAYIGREKIDLLAVEIFEKLGT